MQICLIGNCQIRPLHHLLVGCSLECSYTGIAHLLRPPDQPAAQKAFDDSDIIISQQISDTYPCEFIRTSLLKKQYGAKVLTIVNLYYAGYNPELTYIRLPSGTLQGPLGDYHSLTLVRAWHEKSDTSAGVALLQDHNYNAAMYSDAIPASMKELKLRESLCDVLITDYIENNQSGAKFFHTMNHPCNELLTEYAARITKAVGIHSKTTAALGSEVLGAIRLPTNPAAIAALGLHFDESEYYAGVALNDSLKPAANKARNYSAQDLAAAFQDIYNANRSELTEWCKRRLLH